MELPISIIGGRRNLDNWYQLAPPFQMSTSSGGKMCPKKDHIINTIPSDTFQQEVLI